MNYLITGGTGFIGSELVKKLVQKGDSVTVLSRKKNQKNSSVRFVGNFSEIDQNEKIDCVINLAGEPIAAKKWSRKQKEILLSSRLDVTKKIIELIAKLNHKPCLLISASAIGFYGSNEDEILDEKSPHKIEFTNQLCSAWEAQALEAQVLGVRTCIIRLGVVLEKNGGALAKMLPAFKFGLGGKIASGKQFMSWVHRQDVLSAIDFLINNDKLSGVFNVTSPNPLTNAEFTQALAKTLRRPAFFDMPLFVVKMLFGEMGETLLAKGQRVYPKNLLDSGFDFRFKNLRDALIDICG
jgi:uncharacterized protein (TIGR01777 family)